MFIETITALSFSHMYSSLCFITWAMFSLLEYSDVSAYRLSLSEDTKALNQLVYGSCPLCSLFFPSICLLTFLPLNDLQNILVQEGKEMASILYTYRSCVKALPQVHLGLNFWIKFSLGPLMTNITVIYFNFLSLHEEKSHQTFVLFREGLNAF